MSAVSVGALAGALTTLALAVIRRWRRRNRHSRAPIALGALLISLSVLVGAWLLPLREGPRRHPPAIGIVPPVTGTPSEGFAAAMTVRLDGCDDPVSVTLVLNGTAEYWSSAGARVKSTSEFSVAIPDTDLRDIVLGTSTLATVMAFPTRAVPLQERLVRVRRSSERHGFTVISGEMTDWKETLASVVISFKADWLSRRGLGSCFLRLPALAGTQTVYSAQEARGKTTRRPQDPADPLQSTREVIQDSRSERLASYDPRFEVTNGRTIVVARDGSVLPEASLPAPDATIEGNAAWTCETHPLGTATLPGQGKGDVVVSERGTGAAYSRKRLEAASNTGCSSVAAVAVSGASTQRDVFFLLIGAMFSMGAGMMMEQLLDWVKGAPGSPGRRRTPRRRRRRDRD